MDKKLYIFLILLFPSVIYCREECRWLQSHTFTVNDDLEFSFIAEIKKLDGLVIDIIYEDRENDRMEISPKKSAIYKHNGKEYIPKDIDSFLTEGSHNINLHINTGTLDVICTEMKPATFVLQSTLKSIKVSALKLKICEEICNIDTSIEKIINNEDNFKITAFTTSKYPININISNPVEEGTIGQFEIKPRDCVFKRDQMTQNIPCDHINSGWNKMNIIINRTTLFINNYIILPIDFDFTAINISGSYLVNCKKGTPEWEISNEESISIPISFGQEIVFILTSHAEFSPVFNLHGNKLILNWDNGLTIGSGDPLKAGSYSIIFKATSEMLILYNEKKTDILIELKNKKAPEFIGFSSVKGKYQLALSVEDLSQLSIKPVPDTGPSSVIGQPWKVTTTTSPTANPIVITCSVLIPVAIAIIALIMWKKTIKKNSKKNKVKEYPEYAPVSNKDPSDGSKMSRHESDDLSIVTVHTPPKSISSSSSNLSVGSCADMVTQDTNHAVRSHVEGVNIEKLSRKELDNKKVFQEECETIDKRLTEFAKNKPVTQVMEELDNLIESVFNVVKRKQLYGLNSADSLLRDNGLPGTIRDSQGNSILHCLIFPIQQEMNVDELKKFLLDHKVLANATNYKGQTPLHTLVIEASKGYSKEGWTSMAQLLLDFGCDPRVYDNNGQLPEEIALYRDCIYLQNLLRKCRMNMGEIIIKLKIDQWPDLLKATKGNEIELVRQLLLDNVPILPLCSSTDPLREAIQRGNIEITMLLLSAGAPVCGRPLVGLNSLEVSHSAPGLTVVLPAMIRREFYNCLRSESEMFISGNDSNLAMLKQAVTHLAETIKNYGYRKSNWNFSSESINRSERSKEARKMLRLAASIGMGLTCQMLGLEDVFLHPLPLEISPDNDAKPNALVILCRDLELSLSLKEGNIPSYLKEEYEEYNFKKLRGFCKDNDINFKSLYDKEIPVNKKVLKYIAEQGLDIIYKKVFKVRNGQLVDIIVDAITGFTMLHSAAYNGRMGMVEYLLLNNANERSKTKTGFTAAHVAAMRGHKECMEYILAFSKLSQSLTNDKTNSGLTANQISDGYAAEVSNLDKFLLHVNVSHSILSEPNFGNKAKLVLNEKKSIIKDCLSKGSLDHIIPPGYIKENRNIWKQLKDEAKNFIQKLTDIDSRFNGKIIEHHRNEDALELLLMDSYQIYLEIDNKEHWNEKNMHEAFIESGYKVLQEYTVISTNLCLVPPVFKQTAIGANIFLSHCSEHITTHISIHIIPVHKEKLNLDIEGLQLSQIFHDTIAQTSVMHIANIKSGKSYVTVDIEKQLFAKVDSNKLLVLSVCRYIKKILFPHWWFPRLESRRHGRQWLHYAVSLQTVPERLLIGCFLWEVFKVPEEKWDTFNVLDRVIDIYKQMVIQDENGVMMASPNAKCFLDPGKEGLKVSTNIPVIIDFLKEL